MTGGSCNACLRIARRRGIAPGSRLRLRGGHVGIVAEIQHSHDGIMVLVHSSDEQEILLLTLAAAAGRECVDVARGQAA